MQAKKIAKMVAAICLGAVCTLGLLEFGLRAAKAVRLAESGEQARVAPRDWSGAVRIVVLGESTSAPIFRGGPDFSWPAKLESQLNARFSKRRDPPTFRIVNLARSASSSPFQVALFEREVARLQPDILISMLGVNDARVHALEGDYLYENFYLVRFLYWAEVAWSCPKCQDLNIGGGDLGRVEVSEQVRAEANAAFRELSRYRFETKEEIDQFERWLTTRAKMAGHEQHYVNAVVAEHFYALSQSPRMKGKDAERRLLNEGKSILDRSYQEMVLKRSLSLQHYCHFRTMLRESGCIEAFKDAMQSGMVLTPQLMTIGALAGAADDEFLRKVYRSSGFELSTEKIGGRILARSYLRLEEIVRKFHIVWMPMQYPRGSVGALEFYMSAESTRAPLQFAESFFIPAGKFEPRLKDVILISNENFNAVVTPEKEAEYFIDFFGRDQRLNFGHTTEKGYDLIATNAADQIEKSWPEIEPRLHARKKDARP